MAEKDSGPKPNWPVPILLLVTLAGGYLFTQSPLKSFRPFQESLKTPLPNTEQQVPARLWQDPLEAVIKYNAKPHPSPIITEQMQTAIGEVIHPKNADHGNVKHSDKVAVLITTLDDSPYSEGRETRTRVRYVVGAALNHVCYVPDNAESIGLMHWPTKKLNPDGSVVKDKHGDKSQVLEVPFEWYRKRDVVTCDHADDYPAKVLVLWVKSSDIDRAPLYYLSRLVTSLVFPNNDPSLVSVKLLGPWGSDALRVMIEAARTSDASLMWAGSHVELLSPWATADPLLLLASEKASILTTDPPTMPPQFGHHTIASHFRRAGVDWAYSIGSDRNMMVQLREELARRNVDISQAKIAVVSEWDTFYGRMLPLEFRAMALCTARDKAFCASDEDWRQALNSSRAAAAWQNDARKGNGEENDAEKQYTMHIDRYTYMRGLDGESAHEEHPPAAKSRKTDQDSLYELWKDEQSISSLERPDGPSQYDYVRRLSAQLSEGQQDGGRYVAIGVLGSDPHDKLLILQALRDEFPGAVFFTTDLDARFLHASQQAWARNLIIASPFGLRLDEEHQRDIPPFRDSYQTAAYHALITSFTMAKPKSGEQRDKLAAAQSLPHGCLERACVRLFEVGRTQFINLSTTFPELPHPNEEGQRAPSDPGTTLARTAFAFFFACVLTFFASRQLASYLAAIGSSLLLGLAASWHLSGSPDSEPFFWAEGVSIWPTELVRLLAGMLAIVFILTTLNFIRKSKARIEAEYLHHSIPRPEAFDFAKIWTKHDSQTRGWTLAFKVLLGVILGVLLLLPIFISFERPSVPARGGSAQDFDWYVLRFSVAALYVLLVLVAYLSISCRKLLDDLRDHRLGFTTTWGRRHWRTLPKAVINDWFAIDVSAEYTTMFKTVTPYPLYVLFLLIVSRNNYFDHWTFPLSLVLAYMMMFGFSTLCSIQLWSSGNKLRKDVLQNLEKASVTAYLEGDTILASNIEKVMQEVNALKRGVYGSWADQPIWNTILYPLGGVTILSFLDFMSGR